MEWLGDLLNICVKTASVPDNWKIAIIVPLYEGKGSKNECKILGRAGCILAY